MKELIHLIMFIFNCAAAGLMVKNGNFAMAGANIAAAIYIFDCMRAK